MSFFLGVDAGGTKTEFLLGDDTNVLARVITGSIKRMRVSTEVAEANLHFAAKELERLSGISLGQITHCRIGAAGNTVSLVRDWLLEHFPQYFGGEISIVNDVEIALDDAFNGTRGILILAGAGSNFAGRASNGTVLTAGGWGPNLADQGSANLLSIRALRRAFLAIDQERPTNLIKQACALWHLSCIDDLVAFANLVPAPDFSQFAPSVVACAEAGDQIAIEVVEKETSEMANLVSILIEKIRRIETNVDFKTPRIAYTGSIITTAHCIRKKLEIKLKEQYPDITILEHPADSAMGALWGARNRQQQKF